MKYLLILPALLIGIAFLGARAAPPESVWLGSGIVSPSDTAVYLSYLRQGADGHLLLSNLYAVEPNHSRFDLVWSLLGLLSRTGIPIIIVQEIARAISTIALIISVGFAARSVIPSKRDADLAAILIFGGIGAGWLYTLILHALDAWTPTTIAAADVASEFAVGPALFGGVHIILSIALLITALRLIWRGCAVGSRRDLILGGLAGAALIAFHPYATPLLGLFSTVAAILSPISRGRITNVLLVAAILSLPAVYYIWLLGDPTFAIHHFRANDLPLASPTAWIATLLPFAVAGIWMRQKRLRIALDWPIVWIFCATVLLLLLPVPWKRKLAEGLLVPLILLTMPAWMAVRNGIRNIRPTSMKIPIAAALLLAAWLGPLQLFFSQLMWWQRPSASTFFFVSTELVAATDHLRQTTDERDILLADAFWINTWLPSLTGLRVWIGHDQETPLFSEKNGRFQELLQTSDPEMALETLKGAGVTRFITTTEKSRERFMRLLHPSWRITASFGAVSIWERADYR